MMAFNTPIPAPPRTPTPPPEDDKPQESGLGLDGMEDLLSPSRMVFDSNTLSPMRENFRYNQGNSSTVSLSQPLSPLSPTSVKSVYSNMSSESNGSRTSASLQDGKGPFNFQPMYLAKSPVSKSVSTP